MIQNNSTEVRHIPRQASDNALIILDSNPIRIRTKARFIWESSWAKEHESEEMVKEACDRTVDGSRMFRVKQKLKWCK